MTKGALGEIAQLLHSSETFHSWKSPIAYTWGVPIQLLKGILADCIKRNLRTSFRLGWIVGQVQKERLQGDILCSEDQIG